MYCTKCGNEINQGSNFCKLCGSSLESLPGSDKVILSKSDISASGPTTSANPWRRVASIVIDAVVLNVLVLMILGVYSSFVGISEDDLNMFSLVVGIPLALSYFTLLESSKRGASLGKRTMSIRVISGDSGLKKGQAFVRTLVKYIPVLQIVSLIMIFVREDRRALHDLAIGSDVINYKL